MQLVLKNKTPPEAGSCLISFIQGKFSFDKDTR
jgi:hypothetical protein